ARRAGHGHPGGAQGRLVAATGPGPRGRLPAVRAGSCRHPIRTFLRQSMSSQTNNETGAAAPSTPAAPAEQGAGTAKTNRKSRSLLLRILAVVIVLAAVAWGAWYFLEGRWYEDTDDAYVNGNVVQI